MKTEGERGGGVSRVIELFNGLYMDIVAVQYHYPITIALKYGIVALERCRL